MPDNAAVVREFVEKVITQGDIDSAGRYVWEDVVEQVPLPGQGPGLDGLKDVLRGNLQFHLDYFASKPNEIAAYLSQGESRTDSKLDARELAAYASVASLLLNLDEAVTKE